MPATQLQRPFFDEAKRIAELSDALEDYLNRMKAYSLAVSQGDVKNIDKYLGSQDGRDTCIFFGAKADGKDIVAKKDENQEITTFLGLADPKNPLAKNPFHQESWGDFQYTALELRENLEAYKNALISTEFTDHLGQERSLSPAVIKQLEERFTFPGGSGDRKNSSGLGSRRFLACSNCRSRTIADQTYSRCQRG